MESAMVPSQSKRKALKGPGGSFSFIGSIFSWGLDISGVRAQGWGFAGAEILDAWRAEVGAVLGLRYAGKSGVKPPHSKMIGGARYELLSCRVPGRAKEKQEELWSLRSHREPRWA
jgi:hypothetical protein